MHVLYSVMEADVHPDVALNLHHIIPVETLRRAKAYLDYTTIQKACMMMQVGKTSLIHACYMKITPDF